MPQAQASIIIRGNIDRIFAVTNDIGRWPELFTDYHGAKVLAFSRDGRFARIEFELTNEKGETWTSWRFLDFQDHLAIAHRVSPLFPFLYMHLTWRYEPVEEGVLLVCTQDFEIDPQAPFSNEQALAYMTQHMQESQQHFKQVIEEDGYLCPTIKQ